MFNNQLTCFTSSWYLSCMSHLVPGRENAGKFITIVPPYNMEFGVLCFIFYFWLLLWYFCVFLWSSSAPLLRLFNTKNFHHCSPNFSLLGFITCILYCCKGTACRANIWLRKKCGLPLRHLTGPIRRNHSRSFFQQCKHNWWIALFSRFLSTLVPSSILKAKESWSI